MTFTFENWILLMGSDQIRMAIFQLKFLAKLSDPVIIISPDLVFAVAYGIPSLILFIGGILLYRRSSQLQYSLKYLLICTFTIIGIGYLQMELCREIVSEASILGIEHCVFPDSPYLAMALSSFWLINGYIWADILFRPYNLRSQSTKEEQIGDKPIILLSAILTCFLGSCLSIFVIVYSIILQLR